MTPEQGKWFADWWPIWGPIVAIILTALFVAANRRGGERAARKNPLPPTWPEMWAKIDALEKSDRDKTERIETLEEQLDLSQKHLHAIAAEKDEIIQHVLILEAGYPNPPGPPPRPWLVIKTQGANP